jgi:hypothetical protein
MRARNLRGHELTCSLINSKEIRHKELDNEDIKRTRRRQDVRDPFAKSGTVFAKVDDHVVYSALQNSYELAVR